MMILGADPDQLEATAARVLARADEYDDACNHIAHWMRRMDWQGPEAERFQATFESQMRPQLNAAAAFLRQAAAELRAQATAQFKVSQAPDVVGSASLATAIVSASLATATQILDAAGFVSPGREITEDQGSSWLDSTESFLDMFFPVPTGPFGGMPPKLPSFTDVVGLIGMGSDFVGFGSLAYLRHVNALPGFGARLPQFGLERIIGGSGGAAVGGAMAGLGVFMGAYNLPGHVGEVGDAWDKMHQGRYIQPEDMADLIDAGADTVLDVGGMLGGFYTPAGLLVNSFGYGLKLGANLDTPIIWACDNIIYPAWETGTDALGGLVDVGTDALGGLVDVGTDALGGLVDVGTDALGGLVDVGTDALGGLVDVGTDALGGLVDVGTDALGGLVETGTDALGGLVETGTDGLVDLGNYALGGLRNLF